MQRHCMPTQGQTQISKQANLLEISNTTAKMSAL